MFIGRSRINKMYESVQRELVYGNTYTAKRLLEEMKDARRNAFLWTSIDKQYCDRLICSLERDIRREEIVTYPRRRVVVEPIALSGKQCIAAICVLAIIGIIASLLEG